MKDKKVLKAYDYWRGKKVNVERVTKNRKEYYEWLRKNVHDSKMAQEGR